MLNKFGHGMSASQVQELDTDLAEEALGDDETVPVPSNIDRAASVIMAADYNDFHEDTLTGGNTTHCTNSIVIQRSTPGNGDVAPQAAATCRSTHHRRSLRTLPLQVLPQHNAGSRCGPGKFDLELQDLGGGDTRAVKSASARDFAWLLARLPSSSSELLGSDGPQTVPA